MLLAAALATLIVAVHRASPRTLVSAHGLLHAAVAQEFLDGDGRVPPENPFFAGRPLPYYWFFHWSGAQVSAELGLDPLRAFELLIIAAGAAVIAAGGLLGWRLYRSALAAVALPALVLAGAHPQAPLVLAARAWRHGLAEDRGAYLWGIAHPLMAQMRLWDPFALHGPLLNFFLNITARPVAIGSLLLALLALERWLARGGAGRGLLLAAATALCTALNPVIGLGAAACIATALSVCALAARRAPAAAAPHSLPRVAGAATLLVLGAAAAAPTFAHLLGRAAPAGGLPIHDAGGVLAQLRSMAASAWLLAALAAAGVARAAGAPRFLLSALVLAAGGLVAGAALLRLPVGNEVNLFHAALVVLAVPAAGFLSAPGRPGWLGSPALRGAVVAAAFAPTAALVVLAYTGRPPVPMEIHGREYVRTPADSDRARLYAWIRAEVPEEGIVVIDPASPDRAAGGNTHELPAFTGRPLFTERADHYLVHPYPDSERRARIAAALAAGEPLGPEDAAYLEDLGRPILVVGEHLDDPGRAAALRAVYGAPRFRSGALGAYAWKPDGAS